jgi:glycosyltransferase involved in cell wall biosynthesis
MDIRIFYKECRSLARAGMQVTLLTPNGQDEVKEDVRIKAVPKVRGRLSRMTRTVWNMYREAVRQDADLYHFHDPELIPVGLLLRARGKKVIYDVHEDVPKDILSKHYLPEWSRGTVSWAARAIEDATCRRFSALVVVTPAIKERFQSLHKRTVMIRNFPIPEEIAVGPGIPWESREMAVAYVGGITGLRGIREMVQAMALLPDSLPATLKLAGSSLYEDNLDDLPRMSGWNRTRHLGYLDRAGIASLFNTVRAGLVLFHPAPNHLEAMPMKLFEYMAAGIPIIASHFPAWRELVGGAGCGLLVDPLQPQAIAEAIEYVLTHPAEAEEMGRRGQAAVREAYNWDSQAQKLIHLYCELLELQCAE